MMQKIKDQLVDTIKARAIDWLGKQASELVRARPEEKELLLADTDFQDWMAESCDDCLEETYG